MFYVYANAKSEIQICSNKHEIGLALLVQYVHNILEFRPLVIFCYRKARFMSDLVINLRAGFLMTRLKCFQTVHMI